MNTFEILYKGRCTGWIDKYYIFFFIILMCLMQCFFREKWGGPPESGCCVSITDVFILPVTQNKGKVTRFCHSTLKATLASVSSSPGAQRSVCLFVLSAHFGLHVPQQEEERGGQGAGHLGHPEGRVPAVALGDGTERQAGQESTDCITNITTVQHLRYWLLHNSRYILTSGSRVYGEKSHLHSCPREVKGGRLTKRCSVS